MAFTGQGTGIQNASDTFFSSLKNGQELRYNAVTAKWNNKSVDIYNVKDFGAVGDGVADDTMAVQAAIDAAATTLSSAYSPGLPAGAVLLVGTFKINGTLTPRSRVALVGIAPDASRLVGTGAQLMVTPTGGTAAASKTIISWQAENISFECANGPAWDISGGFYDGLSKATFDNCRFWTLSTSAAAWRHRGTAQMIWGNFTTCTFENRASSATNRSSEPLIDVSVNGGNIWNSNTYRNCIVIPRYAAAPAIRVECTNGGYLWHNVWDHVTGEFCAAGLIHLRGCTDFLIDSCPEWDTMASELAAYDGNIFDFRAAQSVANYCTGEIRRSYRVPIAGGSPLGAGIYDIYAVVDVPSGTTRKGIRIVDCDGSTAAPASILANGSVEVVGRTKPFKVVTGNYSVSTSDPDTIVVNSASAVTINLPPATTAVWAQQLTIKNIGAGTVTIPQLVDGAPDTTLSQWQKITVTTDGYPAALGRIWFTV